MYTISSVAVRARSWFSKQIWAVGTAVVVLLIGGSACQDSPLPTAPTPLTPPEASSYRYPTEEEYAEMPVEFRQAPGIYGLWVDAGFVSGRAYAQASMEYFANHAEIFVKAVLLRDNREITSTTGAEEHSFYLPATRHITASASVGVSGSCGHMLNASGHGKIRHQFPLLKMGWFQWGHAGRTGHASASQPECTCATTTSLDDAAYDPYSDGDDGSMPCGESDSGGTASGVQFYPGDNTGGETVDWNSGKGNGGKSACGAAAVVEYVCFDTWNEEKQQFEEWGCGYVTTC